MRRLWGQRVSLSVAVAMSVPCVAGAADFGVLGGALAESKPIFDARLRYESVDQAPLAEEADAETVRMRLGFETGKAWNTTFLAEGEVITELAGSYRDDPARASNLTYPVVPDPETEEINRLQLVNTSLPGTTVTLGRQRIALDDQRFVGNVAWRQNEQTFDAVRIVNKPTTALTLDATYLNQVNRIFGRESPQGRYHGDGALANAAYQFGFGKLSAFGYWLDFDAESGLQGGLDPTRVSNETFGARLAGERPLSKMKVAYTATFARQSDYGSNPLAFDLDYYSVELTGTYRQFSVTLGQEVMEGNGTVGFATPLATMHRFHGWADKFLTTPANGIDDRYVSLGYMAKGVATLDTLSATLVYRDFESERLAQDLGDEIDLQLQAKYQRFVGLLKVALYEVHEGRTPAAYQDTTKFWAQLEYVW
ncbi:MAG TPA: alginate export family protein [Steroidobacter sp.]|uniref:alginate export family protein n=1 Tax=Steroidobacter sp. TaxID=1978227 RepID=UPI002ED8F627